jgi:hypothetical protein
MNPFLGYIDSLVITKGVALHTTDDSIPPRTTSSTREDDHMNLWLKKQVEHLTTWLTFVLTMSAAVYGYTDLVVRLARIETRNEISDGRQKIIEEKLDRVAKAFIYEGAANPRAEGYEGADSKP